MGERSTVFNLVQLGVETTPGTAVTVTKQLASLDIQPGIKFNGAIFRPMGQKFATAVQPGREWTEAKVSGNPTFGETTYLLASLMRKGTVANLGASSKKWDFGIAAATEDIPQTYTIEQGSAYRVQRFGYGLVNSGTFTFKRDGITFDGSMIGNALVDDVPFSSDSSFTLTTGGSNLTSGNFTLTIGGTATANIAFGATLAQIQAAIEAVATVGAGNVKVSAVTPTTATTLITAGTVIRVELVNGKGNQAIVCSGTFTGLTPSNGVSLTVVNAGSAVATPDTTPVPMPGTGTTVTFADTWAGLGAASVTAKVITATLAIQDRWGQFWYLDSSKTSFASHLDKAPNATLKVMVEADAAGMSYLTKMRAGTQSCVRIKTVGPLIDTYYNQMIVDMVGLIPPSGVSDFKDEDGVYAVEWTFQCSKDSSGNTIAASLQNGLAAL